MPWDKSALLMFQLNKPWQADNLENTAMPESWMLDSADYINP